MKHVVLFSGGLDSFITLKWVQKNFTNREVIPVYFPLHHYYQPDEVYAILKLQRHGFVDKVIIDDSFDLSNWEEPNANIPMRNSLLVHGAARYGDIIWLTVQKGETGIPDRTKTFMSDIGAVLSHLNGREVYVSSPFFNMTKVEMVKWYLDAGYSAHGLTRTSSCYHPMNGKPCGKCSACFRRWVAFELNGLEEQYDTPPWKSDLAREYLAKGTTGFYGEGRSEEIVKALERKGVR